MLEDFQIGKNVDEQIKHNRENGWPDLNPNQRLFGFQFLILRSPRKAAAAAGLSPSRGSVMLRHPLVSAFIDDLQTQQAIRFNIDADFAMMEMLEAMDKFKGEESINFVDKDGCQITLKKFHAEQYLGLMKELNKVAGVYKDSNAQKGSVNIVMDFGALGLTQEQAKGITIEGSTLDDDEIPL